MDVEFRCGGINATSGWTFSTLNFPFQSIVREVQVTKLMHVKETGALLDENEKKLDVVLGNPDKYFCPQ